ncbi:flagellar assembly protein FliW [Sulfobacillus sp. hq2]|uniref:flagellar assembly protein FliW n=1 Tax=Sulfobacillus TaxID=28033 RepID=UPI000CD32991|nr:flagellar assembly protein FliW [Sulfobacillus sp. hq2]POB10441.1 flagellar biosynthesis protein FliW [Sulfobacillus sp. hq2]
MMTQNTIRTRFHGEITIVDHDILVMDYPILGFANHKEFILLPHRSDSPFLYLQSITDPTLAFIVIDPYTFDATYTVPANELPDLGNQETWAILCICTVTHSATGALKATVNLKSPLIINRETRHGGQFVLSLPYSYQYPLIGEDTTNAGTEPKNR